MTSCWIVTEGMAGTENQCIGVAEALGVRADVKRIALHQPWKILTPWIGFENAATFGGDRLEAPWPDLLIAAGRKSVAAARYIKKQSGRKTFAVQIQDPRFSYDTFDLIAVPAHDPARGENIIVTQGAPNKITAEKLALAKDDFHELLSPLPAPRVAVMIGGGSKAYAMTPEVIEKLAGQLEALAQSGYGLMITASRRTDDETAQALRARLNEPNIYFWDGEAPNPYMGFLAWADFIIVTADSVSMISEAATAGKPLYIAGMEGATAKAARIGKFQQSLIDGKIARPFDGALEDYTYQPLADAALVAAAIRKRMGGL